LSIEKGSRQKKKMILKLRKRTRGKFCKEVVGRSNCVVAEIGFGGSAQAGPKKDLRRERMVTIERKSRKNRTRAPPTSTKG